jgi:tetratricopeptide (TPR) repeat protein
MGKGRLDEARSVFTRATTSFIPIQRPALMLAFALFEEEHGRIQEARDMYQSILAKLPGHAETTYRLATFEKRQNPNDPQAALQVYVDALQREDIDVDTKAFLQLHRARFMWNTMRDIHGARQHLYQAVQDCPSSRLLWMGYFNLEYCQLALGAPLEHAAYAFELFRTCAQLPEYVVQDIVANHVDKLLEFDVDIKQVCRVEQLTKAPLSVVAEQDRMHANKKRKRDEAQEQAQKLAKLSVSTASYYGQPTYPVRTLYNRQTCRRTAVVLMGSLSKISLWKKHPPPPPPSTPPQTRPPPPITPTVHPMNPSTKQSISMGLI